MTVVSKEATTKDVVPEDAGTDAKDAKQAPIPPKDVDDEKSPKEVEEEKKEEEMTPTEAPKVTEEKAEEVKPECVDLPTSPAPESGSLSDKKRPSPTQQPDNAPDAKKKSSEDTETVKDNKDPKDSKDGEDEVPTDKKEPVGEDDSAPAEVVDVEVAEADPVKTMPTEDSGSPTPLGVEEEKMATGEAPAESE